MARERRLAVAAVVILLLAGVAAVAVPGALAEPEEEVVRPGPVRIGEVPVAPGQISGQTAELRLLARVDHYDNPTRNVSVRFRAFDAESGLLVDEQRVSVGTIRGDRSVQVNGSLRVEREGGYVLETTIFREGEVVDQQSRRVSGMGALVPPYARSPVRFADGTALPPLAVSVADAGENRSTLQVTASLTNGGDEASGDLRVEFVLRQADSNLRAATTTESVGTIRPGRTGEADAELTVPNGYNYYVDAVLYRDGVVIDTARSVANLDPTETISADETQRDVEFQVEDFEAGDETDGRQPAGERTPAPTTSTGGPGLGVTVAAVALLAVAGLAGIVRRRRGDR
jgi:MYXO-CTERM domain-containing protein